MKPLRLEIQGFGSFPGTEVIDFAALSTRGLFVVTGPTGSGKTTIFDAMVFALYGDLPGSRERGGSSARSQHAPATQPTQVVFDFEVDGVPYRVTRNPEYERPKQRGEGVTKEKANATLVRLDAGTTAVASGARPCAERCIELIGLEKSQFDLDLPAIAGLWRHGSVVRSWLLDLTESALQKDPQLSAIKGYVDDSGEGRWTVFEAIHESVPAPTIAQALFARFASRQDDSFAMKLIAALRNEFGGHAVQQNT